MRRFFSEPAIEIELKLEFGESSPLPGSVVALVVEFGDFSEPLGGESGPLLLPRSAAFRRFDS